MASFLEKTKTEDLWYLVGLITSDGSLSKDQRHINITSKDHDFIKELNAHFGFGLTIGKKRRGHDSERIYFQIQIGSVEFYRFLLSIGLTPAKSLTLGALQVPSEEFNHFLRGVIDGDGCISTWINKSNGYRQWSLKIVSAAPVYSVWLKEKIEKQCGVYGKIYESRRKDRKNPLYSIKFGKIAAKIILKECYVAEHIVLERKYVQAMRCLSERDGWSKYKTMNIKK